MTSRWPGGACCCSTGRGGSSRAAGRSRRACSRIFDVPQSLLVAKARSARMIAPSDRKVDMPVGEIGFVGMVDRDVFDEWLRERAGAGGRRAAHRHLRRDRARRARRPGGLLPRDARRRGETGAHQGRHRSGRRALGGGQAEHPQCRADAVRVRLSRDHPLASQHARGLRRGALRRVLPGPPLARFLRLGFPARRDRQHRRGQRGQGICAAQFGQPAARGSRARGLRDGAQRGCADPAQAAQAVGQRPRRDRGGRCCGRRRPGVGRGPSTTR